MDSGVARLPRTPGSSFRESIRKSLRRLRRNKKKRGGGGGGDVKRRKEDEPSYQVTVSPSLTNLDGEEDEVYEVIKPQDTEYADTEEDNGRVVIVHESRKPSFKSENQSLATSLEKISADIVVEYSEAKTERNSWTAITGKDSDSTSSQDVEMTEKNISLIKDPHYQLIPRGPLGNLLKQKLSQSSVETVIIHKEIEAEDIPDENIDFKVEHIPLDTEAERQEAEDVESIVSRAMMEDMVGSVVERHLTPALASHPRQATNSMELQLKPGDIVFLHRRLNKDWYLGEKKGVRGLIPAAYIQ